MTRLVLILLGLMATPWAWAQKGWLQASKDSVWVGERFELSVSLENETGAKTVLVKPPKTLGDVELIREVSRQRRQETGNPPVETVVYEASVFGVDSVAVSVPAGWINGTDTTWASIAPLVLSVRRMVPDGAKELKDLTPLYDFGSDWAFWLMLLGGILIGLLLMYYLWRRFRPKTSPVPIAPPETPKTPLETALMRLDALQESEDETVVRAYYTELSDVLRTFIEQEMRVPALESTTLELLQRLKQADRRTLRRLPAEIIDRVGRVLEASDWVKFADFRPHPEDAPRWKAETRALILGIYEHLHPVQTPPESDTPPSSSNNPS